jgi:hypothetical protein
MCILLCLSGIGMQQRQIELASEGQGAVKLYRGRAVCVCLVGQQAQLCTVPLLATVRQS